MIVPEKPAKRVPAIFFRTEGGGEPVRDWLKMTLSAEDRKRVGHDIMTVEYGWPLGMPTCRHLEAGRSMKGDCREEERGKNRFRP
jgi:hypothetical protein